MLISDARANAAARLLRERPADASLDSLIEAERVRKAALHPVLQQPIPSAFRHGSFMPITAGLALGMVSARSSSALLLYAAARA